MNFTNSNVNGDMFKPIEKTQQEIMLEDKEKNQNFKFTNKKEQEERRKKMEEKEAETPKLISTKVTPLEG